ncbi:prolyl oligopeptidase family protein [Scopulibacillus darangshiensis]|uniref:Prolyl oligopeptidase family protein n=1 Tax=Scopulibacillus darangshiensis TaxID=442528 RepID=A0A4R2P9S1_9BACL|nr:alpha/beta fold hydrolase [Scopulibacillus darangshiensis]TCP31789.1 prolyl oligopeptidase family protein [Scopulibacillus darangshiensis]
MNTVVRETPLKPRPRKPLQRKRWLIAFTVLILTFVIAVFGISYYVTNSLIHPERKPIALTPEAVKLKYQDIAFKSREGGLMLNGWLMKADKPAHKWIILSHGYRGTRLIWPTIDAGKPGLNLYKMLHSHGYNVVAFDFRNSGTSDGDTTTVGYYEQQDLLGAIDDVMRRDPKAQIALMGWSQGAATSLIAASKDPSVKMVVADSPFSNLRDYLETNLPHWSHLPQFPFTPVILDFWVPILSGLDTNKVSPINAVKNFNGPILLVHSRADDAIPVSNSKAIYNKYKNNKDIKLMTYPKASHTESFLLFPKRYEKMLIGFFHKNGF